MVDLVSDEVRQAVGRLMPKTPQPEVPNLADRDGAQLVTDARRGYLQQLDTDGLADWAAERGTTVFLLIRPGDYVFPGAPIAAVTPAVEGAEAAVRKATALGGQRMSADDLEFAVRQLVEVAVRALSPGINDPHTAISVLDRLGAALCDAVPLHLSGGVTLRNGRAALIVPSVDYGGLTDAMFHMIRQNAAGSTAVLIRLIEVLGAVASCERAPERLQELQRHADLTLDDAGRGIANPADLEDVRRRHAWFGTVRLRGGIAVLPDAGR